MDISNYNRDYNSMPYETDSTVAAQSSLIKNVYLWMCGALAITGLTAYYVGTSYDMLSYIYGSKLIFWGLIIAEFALVIGINAAINKISAMTATLLFILYAVINGATLASIFAVYSMTAIAKTFFITAGTFGVMAIYGSVTKTDLSKIGNILFMALIGLIIAGIVNIFLKSSTMDLIVSGIGVLVFVGLTAWDAQKIKALLDGVEENETTQKIAVLGALSLYLDFINLFLYLLRFFGGSRD